jgi:hypothetical protein
MLKRTTLVFSAALILGSASMAFAGDQDSATLLATSGRIIEPQAARPVDAYASVSRRKSAPLASHVRGAATYDFQLQGRF